MAHNTTSKAEAPQCLGWVVSCAIIGAFLLFALLAICIRPELGFGFWSVTCGLAALSFRAFDVIVRLSEPAGAH